MKWNQHTGESCIGPSDGAALVGVALLLRGGIRSRTLPRLPQPVAPVLPPQVRAPRRPVRGAERDDQVNEGGAQDHDSALQDINSQSTFMKLQPRLLILK